MGKWIKVGGLNDLTDGFGMVVQADGQDLALFKVAGALYAIHNVCLHKGGPLGEGTLDGAVVTCPWHGWRYDVTTGANPVNPAVQVQSFPVKVEGTDVYVEV